MIGKIALVGVGFVLGARAGRERYETIASTASELAKKLDDYSRERLAQGRLSSDVPGPTSSTS